MLDQLPFASEDLDRIESERVKFEHEQAERTRREECPGCAEDVPVKRMSRIGNSEIFHLMHVGDNKSGRFGNQKWGACWCQRPDLHPFNAPST